MTDQPIAGQNPPALSILLLIRSLNVGGSERQLVQLAEALKERGHQVTVAVYYSGGVLEEPLRRLGVPLLDLRKRGRWDIFGFLFRLAKQVRKARPDVLYSFLNTSNLLSAAIAPFVPSVRRVWSVRASNMDLNAYDWLARLAYRVECALSRRADLIISNSHSGLEFAVANGFPRDRMIVVANGIDTDRFSPDPAARARVRAGWGITDDQILVGMLARLDPMKDYPTFLRAAALAAAGRPDLRFVCVGEGALRAELERLAAELGLEQRLAWVGRWDEPGAALNAFDIFCSTSLFGEGFSNSVAEAMACGLPCVVTDVGDSARIVGAVGRCVPPGDPVAVAEALLETIRDLGSFDREGVRRRVIECFSVEALAENTLRALTPPLSSAAKPDYVRSEPRSQEAPDA